MIQHQVRKVLFKRKRVFCRNCGFLCWQTQHLSGEGPYKYEELPQVWRDEFQTDKFKGSGEDAADEEYYQIYCLRKQWVWTLGGKTGPYYVDINDVKQLRQCVYYIDYQPGFGPEEHKELKREADTTRAIRNATFLGAIIGATAAIIAQLLYVLITHQP
jgi:hypothetical protein